MYFFFSKIRPNRPKKKVRFTVATRSIFVFNLIFYKGKSEDMEENFNIHLGKKLRMRRLSLGLTQTKVADAINVTFQQIQKYEKGTNGVSSSRLLHNSNLSENLRKGMQGTVHVSTEVERLIL